MKIDLRLPPMLLIPNQRHTLISPRRHLQFAPVHELLFLDLKPLTELFLRRIWIARVLGFVMIPFCDKGDLVGGVEKAFFVFVVLDYV